MLDVDEQFRTIYESAGFIRLPDDFHYSETTEIFWEECSDKDAEPSYLFDAELDVETIGQAHSSPLFTQEREELADRRHAYHSYEESVLPAQSFFTHSRTGDPCMNLVRQVRAAEKNKSRNGQRSNQASP